MEGNGAKIDAAEFLKMLFDGYVISYRKFGWHTNPDYPNITTSNYADMTQAELGHFGALGESLGFISRREMNWHLPRDLCWCRQGDKDAYLYIERENEDSKWKKTLERLLNDNAKEVKFIVPIFGWLKLENYEKAKQFLRAGGLSPDQATLLIAWVGENQNGKPDQFKVEGFILAGEHEFSRSADASTDKGGFWQLNYSSSSKWEDHHDRPNI